MVPKVYANVPISHGERERILNVSLEIIFEEREVPWRAHMHEWLREAIHVYVQRGINFWKKLHSAIRRAAEKKILPVEVASTWIKGHQKIVKAKLAKHKREMEK